MTSRDVKTIDRTMLTLATILALLGIAQYYTGARAFGWVIPYTPKRFSSFFALFPYINNAGSFFILAGGLALSRGWRYLPLFGLFAFCTWLTGTRFAWPCFGVLFIVKVFQSRDHWLDYPYFLVLFGLGVGYAAVQCSDYLMGHRWHEYVLNYRIMQDFPWFGVGPWGNIAVHWMYAEDWLFPVLRKNPNVHNDYMVFLVEYGIIGAGLLAAIGGRWLWRARDMRLRDCRGLAVLLVLGHGLIDMPLHCPAVLVMMLVCLRGMK